MILNQLTKTWPQPLSLERKLQYLRFFVKLKKKNLKKLKMKFLSLVCLRHYS